jgi:hypothetical protein
VGKTPPGSARLGLLGVSWGEAALGDDNELHWYHDEALPIPTDTDPGAY